MKRGGKFLVSATIAALAACGGQQGKLEIRSTPTKLSRGEQPVPQRIAEARGQLALGNVALALEAFRIAARDDPNSIDALSGIAICYDRMGRFDLSRRNYEAALALAPADTRLLAAFAASLQLQGSTAEAQSVQQEIALRSAAAAVLTSGIIAEPSVVAAAPASEPVALPAALPTKLTADVSLPERSWTAQPVELAVTEPGRVAVAAPAVLPAAVEFEAEQAAAAPAPAPEAEVRTAAVGQSVTIKLPPARLVQAASAQEPAADPLSPTPISPPPPPEPSLAADRGPRLERVSMGEIALVTVPRPVWRSTAVVSNEPSTKVRYVPLRQASTLPVKVRLLNAARVNRLAARTRNWLTDRGWSQMAIGDANRARARSIILYPADQRWLAQRLSRQFGFAMAPNATSGQITVLLGTDAANHPALRRTNA